MHPTYTEKIIKTVFHFTALYIITIQVTCKYQGTFW